MIYGLGKWLESEICAQENIKFSMLNIYNVDTKETGL